MTITPDDEHRMPKPVADMFRVLELGAVNEHREGKLLDRVEARLRAEGHLVDSTQPTTTDDVEEPTAAADPQLVRKRVKVTVEVTSSAKSGSMLVGALVEVGSAAGVWRLITRGLAGLLLLTSPVMAVLGFMLALDGTPLPTALPLAMVQSATLMVIFRAPIRRLLRYACGNVQDLNSTPEITASSDKRRPMRASRVNVRASRTKGRDNRS